MTPLTDTEALLFRKLCFDGTGGYPIRYSEARGRYTVPQAVSKNSFATKAAAIEAIEVWTKAAAARWQAMKDDHPEVTITAEGIRYLPV